MAGIGFELRKFLMKDNYTGILSAYGYAGLISGGPWLLSILTLFVLTLMVRWQHLSIDMARHFQGIVVYEIAFSLILSAVFQHSYTRYIANQCYLGNEDQICPSLNSIYTVTLIGSSLFAIVAVHFVLPNESKTLKLLAVASFNVLSMIWVTTSVLSGLLAYKTILLGFFASFIVSILLAWCLAIKGPEELLFCYFCGQFVLLVMLNYAIYRAYPTQGLINFDFFKFKGTKKSLLFTGLFYNLAIWIDKFIFWYHPKTGTPLIGKIYESLPYDTPIFLAYLMVVPGMALFFLHIETEFTENYEALYQKICGANTFAEIEAAYRNMLLAGRSALYSIIKSLAYMLLVCTTFGTAVFTWLGLSTAFLPLFYVCLLGAGLNLVFWAALDIIFYLDKTAHALTLTFLFLVTNGLFTWASITMGVFYFGYGLATSLLLTVTLCFMLLNQEFKRLKFQTYMLQ